MIQLILPYLHHMPKSLVIRSICIADVACICAAYNRSRMLGSYFFAYDYSASHTAGILPLQPP